VKDKFIANTIEEAIDASFCFGSTTVNEIRNQCIQNYREFGMSKAMKFAARFRHDKDVMAAFNELLVELGLRD
jgi:hypothetical protein